jgi:hypothetical protein
MNVALLTCEILPEPDADLAPLLAAFEAAGVVAEAVAWDTPNVSFEAYDAVLIRSPWNYPLRPVAFIETLERAAAQSLLINPLEVARANMHKGYLLQLAAAGVPVVPTTLFKKGSMVDDSTIAGPVVVKPAVSCGSWNTKLFEAEQAPEALAFAVALIAERDIMVQPVMPGFTDPGERAVVWIDGGVQHAMLKRPRFAGMPEQLVPIDSPSAADVAIGERALQHFGERILYGRVDLIDGPDGPMVSEVECLEPSLYFHHYEGAAHKLVRAVQRVCAP